jgi:hypothetical protein
VDHGSPLANPEIGLRRQQGLGQQAWPEAAETLAWGKRERDWARASGQHSSGSFATPTLWQLRYERS